MMRKMIVLYGKSGTGKSTIEKILKDKYYLSKCVSHTTRRKRDGETNGKDYYFVSKEDFDKLLLDGAMLEYTIFDGNYYGIAKNEIPEYSCLVAEPNGVSQILNNKHIITPFVVQLYASDDILKQRMLERGDSEASVTKRQKNDKTVFDTTLYNIVPDLLIDTTENDVEKITESIYNKFINTIIMKNKFINKMIEYKTTK